MAICRSHKLDKTSIYRVAGPQISLGWIDKRMRGERMEKMIQDNSRNFTVKADKNEALLRG